MKGGAVVMQSKHKIPRNNYDCNCNIYFRKGGFGYCEFMQKQKGAGAGLDNNKEYISYGCSCIYIFIAAFYARFFWRDDSCQYRHFQYFDWSGSLFGGCCFGNKFN